MAKTWVLWRNWGVVHLLTGKRLSYLDGLIGNGHGSPCLLQRVVRQKPILLRSQFASHRQLRVSLPLQSKSFAPTLPRRPLLHRTDGRDYP